MAIDVLKSLEMIETLENYIERVRPPLEIRKKLDIGYRIEGQSVFIVEIRPRWDKPDEYMELSVAKTTFVHKKNYWKIFWLRGNLKWYLYDPHPHVKTLREFLDIVEEDELGCFWG